MELYELKNQRSILLDEAQKLLDSKDYDGHKSKMAEIQALNTQISAIEAQLAEESRFSAKLEPILDKAAQTAQIIMSRGGDVLTAEENAYWGKVINASKSGNPKNEITLIPEIMPLTVINEIFKYIKAEHPLLGAINIQSASAVTRILSATTAGKATWGDLCATIDSEISGGFSFQELTLTKLYAHMFICNANLDLGPTYLHRFAITALGEAIATELEKGYVYGDGKKKPIGMARKLTGATDGVYPLKTAVAITDLSPTTFGTLLDTLSNAPNGKRRAVGEVILIVNPSDYFTKVYPATTPRASDGTFNYNVLPYPTKIVQSEAIPVGSAIIGIAKEYFAGIGAGTDGGKLEYSDEYKFLEDKRTYRIKLYGNGRARTENDFILLDVSGLKPFTYEVKVVEKVVESEGV